MVLRMKNVNILGVHWKIWFSGGGGFTKNQYRGGEDCLKKGALIVCQFKEGGGAWQERGGWCFWGYEFPKVNTLEINQNALIVF